MEWFIETFRQYPELLVFLTLSLGYFIGGFKIGKFSLGTVTSVLLVGVLVGQLGITISPDVKSVFFLMFLFAVGYSVGPQFFGGLKKDGLPQMAFAVVVCILCLVFPYIIGKFMGYDMGLTAGMLAGSQTISAVIGVASDTINQLNIPADQKSAIINKIPVAYAVTYIFGTAGSAWLLSSIGPKLLGGNLVEKARELETQLGGDSGTGGSEHLRTSWGIIPSVEYYPIKSFNLKFYGTYVGRYLNYSDYSVNSLGQVNGNTGRIMLGVSSPLVIL